MGLELVFAGLISLFAVVMTSSEADLPTLMHGKILMYAPWVVQSGMLHAVAWIGGLSIVSLLLKSIFSALLVFTGRFQAASVGEHLGQLLFKRLLFAPYHWHLRQSSAKMIYAVQGREYAILLLDGVQQVCVGIMLSFSVCIVVLLIDPLGGALLLSSLGGLGILVFQAVKRAVDKNAKLLHRTEVSISECVQMSLQGIKELKIYGAEDAFIGSYRSELLRTPRISAALATFAALPTQLLEIIAISGMVAFVWSMYALLERSPAEVVGFAGFLSVACWRVLPALNRVFSSLTGIRRSIPRLEMYLTFLQEVSQDDLTSRTIDVWPSLSASIDFNDVAFRYSGANSPALINISVKIPRGAIVGIVGTSGSGKSTFTDLLAGLLSPTQGSIQIDEMELSGEDHCRAWMKRVGYVAQNPYMLDASLAENVAFGISKEQIDYPKVAECCRKAALAEFIETLPEGLNTGLGERGELLSGGQRQRVAIARALYTEPDLLIFDEATSALDNKNEEMVLNTVQGLRYSLTQVVVAHRLSTVETCDLIIWLEAGRIREIGAASEVIPAYRSFLNRLEQFNEGSRDNC
jgi:ABC-type multidrug transport system fused ATPase/permease subunit